LRRLFARLCEPAREEETVLTKGKKEKERGFRAFEERKWELTLHFTWRIMAHSSHE